MAQKVKQGEILVLLLIGHGAVCGDGDFQFLIITEPNKMQTESFITKSELEASLRLCKGDILVVCNSCYSGCLVSDRWTLLCSASPEEPSYALTQSGSGHVRGSAFTACLVAQAAEEHGLRVPLPRTVPLTGSDLSPLYDPPSHSFPTQLSALKPSSMTMKEFVGGMHKFEKLLVQSYPSVFQTSELKSTISWTRIIPLHFKAKVMGRIQVKPTPADHKAEYNSMFIIPGQQGGPSLPTPESQTHQLDPLLITLATAMSEDVCKVFRAREMIYAKICADLRQHIAEPQRYASPIQPDTISEESLLFMLRAIHVQAVGVQQIARVLGWSDAVVVPFLPWTMGNGNIHRMIASGFRIDKLSWHLKVNHFPEYVKCFDFT